MTNKQDRLAEIMTALRTDIDRLVKEIRESGGSAELRQTLEEAIALLDRLKMEKELLGK